MEKLDLVVIGAGLHGLIVSKTYLEVHPRASIAIFDNAQSIGGVWAKERLYPGLKTNNHWEAFEFSDFPMTGFGLEKDRHIPGAVVHEYLEAFAEHYNLQKRIALKTTVLEANYQGVNGWKLSVEGPQGAKDVFADRLVVATGLNSTPSKPKIAGMEQFGKPVLHTKEWATHVSQLNGLSSVAVMGGAKSSMDVANYFATQGVQVHWIIRKSGHGPGWTMPSRLTPLKIRVDKLITTRFITTFSPCMWAENGWWRRFLQRTWLGRKIVTKFFADNQKDVLTCNGYDKHPETAKLKPWTDIVWHGGDISVLNYDEDIMAQVREGKIQVHVSDIDHLAAGQICLSDDTRLDADVLFCATGWEYRPSINFTGVSASDLSLPQMSNANRHISEKADEQIFRDYPVLKTAPRIEVQPLDGIVATPSEPYRLFRFTVPPKLAPMKTLAFSGALHNVTTCITAQVQASWIVAYFDDRLDCMRRPVDEIMFETYLHTQFCKRRTPMGFADRHPDFSSDSLSFVDLLLKDLGLPAYRKGSMFKELFQPYTRLDYVGLVREWLAKRELTKAG